MVWHSKRVPQGPNTTRTSTRTPGLWLVVASAFVFVAASTLMWTGCQKQKVPVTESGQPVVQFRPAMHKGSTWTGEIIVADQVVARGLTYAGTGAGDLVRGEVVDVAWVPGTMRVEAVQKGSAQWWYVGGVLLYIVAIAMEEVGRRRMADARTGGTA